MSEALPCQVSFAKCLADDKLNDIDVQVTIADVRNTCSYLLYENVSA